MEQYSQERVIDASEEAAVLPTPNGEDTPEHSQPSVEHCRRKGQVFRMTYIKPLGQHIPVDEELLAALERASREQAKKAHLAAAITLGVVILLAALCIVISLVTP